MNDVTFHGAGIKKRTFFSSTKFFWFHLCYQHVSYIKIFVFEYILRIKKEKKIKKLKYHANNSKNVKKMPIFGHFTHFFLHQAIFDIVKSAYFWHLQSLSMFHPNTYIQTLKMLYYNRLYLFQFPRYNEKCEILKMGRKKRRISIFLVFSILALSAIEIIRSVKE